MHLELAFIMDPGDVWIIVAIVAAWMVFMCLRTLAIDIDYATRWHNLMVEARTLQMRQRQRMRELAAKAKALRDAA